MLPKNGNFVPIPLKNSKSESWKFLAGNANWREFILDWVLRAISEFHTGEPEFGCPLGQKLQLLLYGPEIFRTSGKMELFNEMCHEPTLQYHSRVRLPAQTWRI
jgi:hypothetical protein